MKVSVITVSFNAVSCIERTIKSVISQRYNDFEYIIVDGQSNDGTIEIIQKYHVNISKWISKPDRGIYNAMNKAVRMCSGEYCIFMNAGDMFVNPLVLKQVSLFLDDGFDVLTGCEISTKNGKIVDYVKPPQKATLKHFFVTSISHQASFIKRSLLLEYPYDEHLKLVSDWKFWLQTLVLDGKSYRSIDVDVCVFNHDGMTYAFSDIGNMERKKVLMSLLPKDVYKEYVRRYSGFWFAKKRRYYGKLQRILHREELKNKLKMAKSYVDVLGFYGFIVIVLKILNLGEGGKLGQSVIARYLQKHYGHIVRRNEMASDVPHAFMKKFPIWVCWWQGEKMMPLVPKLCLYSLRKNLRDNQELYFITKRNYKDFVNIPEYVVRKMERGMLSVTAFSDILRFTLLARYGGLWVDATCYVAALLPDLSSADFYTSKQNKPNDYRYVSRYRWASYLIGGKPGHKIFLNMRDLFFAYIWREKSWVSYFLLDYLLDLICRESDECNHSIESFPYTEMHVLESVEDMDKPFNEVKPLAEGIFHKLSWKRRFRPYTDDMSRMTLFGYIIDNF